MFLVPGNTQTVQFDYTGWCSLCQALLKRYSLTIQSYVPCARHYSSSTVWLYRVMFPVPGNTQTVQFDYTEWCSLCQAILKQYSLTIQCNVPCARQYSEQYSLTIQGNVPCARQYSNSTVWLYRVMFPVPGNTQAIQFDYTEWCSLCQAIFWTVQCDYTGWCSTCQAIFWTVVWQYTVMFHVPGNILNSKIWLHRVMFPVPGNILNSMTIQSDVPRAWQYSNSTGTSLCIVKRLYRVMFPCLAILIHSFGLRHFQCTRRMFVGKHLYSQRRLFKFLFKTSQLLLIH